MTASEQSPPGPLAGIRIVEISETASGAYGGRLLAGLDGEVVVVEPLGGSALRRVGSHPGARPHRETGASHLHLQRGKRSLTVNLESRAGRRALHELLEATEILITDLPARSWAPLGIDPARLLAQNPALIVTTITPFGSQGPRVDQASTELTEYAAGGYLRITGKPEREPVKAWGEQAQLQAGVHAALATVAAVRAKGDAHRGQHVDVAVTDAVSFLLGGTLQSAYFFGREPSRNGTRLVGFGPGHTYPSTIRPCRDGYVHAHVNSRFPETMAAFFDDPRLADPDLLATMLGHADEIDALMSPKLEREDRAEIVREAQALRIPFTEVLRPSEVLADGDGHHAARGFFVDQDHPIAGRARYPGPPIRMGESRWREGRAPLLNEDGALLHHRRLSRGHPSRSSLSRGRPSGDVPVRWRRAGVA
jgi:benzylsuccinate CoA-transferase BbsE subunit